MYEMKFGFTGKPFQLLPDPGFFFNSQTHRKAMAYLRYGLAKGEGVVTITGDVGTGKTTLAGILYHKMVNDGDAELAQIRHTQFNPNELLQAVAHEFGVPLLSDNKVRILASIEQHLQDVRKRHKRAILLVDEAQNLTSAALEELRLLNNMEQNGAPLLQLCLLGQNEFKQLLKQPHMEHFRQRIVVAYHLSTLTLEETRQYISHRLTKVGWTGTPQLTDAAYIEIHGSTGGLPRKINLLCDRVLLFASLEDLDQIDDNVIRNVNNDMRAELGADIIDGVAPPTVNSPLEPTPIALPQLQQLTDELQQLKQEVQLERRFIRQLFLHVFEQSPESAQQILAQLHQSTARDPKLAS